MLKYSEILKVFPAFLPCVTKNPHFENFHLKWMEFRVNCGADDEERLSPFEEDKPKCTGITPFKAGLDYILSAIRKAPVFIAK